MWPMLDHKQNRSIHHSLRKKMEYANAADALSLKDLLNQKFPEHQIETDNDGQIVIYLGVK